MTLSQDTQLQNTLEEKLIFPPLCRKRSCSNALSVSMVLLETIPGPLGVRVDMLEMDTVPGSPGITADMLEIVLGPPSTKEKVPKTVPAPHDIK